MTANNISIFRLGGIDIPGDVDITVYVYPRVKGGRYLYEVSVSGNSSENSAHNFNVTICDTHGVVRRFPDLGQALEKVRLALGYEGGERIKVSVVIEDTLPRRPGAADLDAAAAKRATWLTTRETAIIAERDALNRSRVVMDAAGWNLSGNSEKVARYTDVFGKIESLGDDLLEIAAQRALLPLVSEKPDF